MTTAASHWFGSRAMRERAYEPRAAGPKKGVRTEVFTVIVPAHNEERGLKRILPVLDSISSVSEVIVVANGCTDGTVAVAQRFESVAVHVLDQPSKRLALNLGDSLAKHFPRIYLDADIDISAAALEALAEVLDCERPVLAAPSPRFDTSRSSSAVRLFYEIFDLLPHAKQPGSGGIYGVSKAGRLRFGEFPEQMGDDLFVKRHFDEGESVVSPGLFVVDAPRDLKALLRVRTRVARGNRELARTADVRFGSSTHNTARHLVGLMISDPRYLLGGVVYSYIVLRARLDSYRVRASVWLRDETTR